MLTELIF